MKPAVGKMAKGRERDLLRSASASYVKEVRAGVAELADAPG